MATNMGQLLPGTRREAGSALEVLACSAAVACATAAGGGNGGIGGSSPFAAGTLVGVLEDQAES